MHTHQWAIIGTRPVKVPREWVKMTVLANDEEMELASKIPTSESLK